MRLVALSVPVLLSLAALGFAQGNPAGQAAAGPAGSAAARAPRGLTAEQVLEKYIEATGGRAAYEKHKSLVLKGSMEAVGLNIKGAIEAYSKAPNKALAITELPGVGTQKQGYNGTVGWASDALSGVRELTGVELAQFKRASTFNSDIRWRELWKSAELVGVEKVGDRDAYAVRLTPKEGEGNPVTNYYDTKTFLLLRSDSVQESPLGTLPVTSLMSDYRTVGGVKMPFLLEQKLPTMTIRISFSEAVFDVPIEDARFEKPQ